VAHFPLGAFEVCGMPAQRTDFCLKNVRGIELVCTLFEPSPPTPLGSAREKCHTCVVFAHGAENGCRLDAFELVPALLPLGIALACLDLSGAGHSGGELVSCGFHERDDLRLLLGRLRHLGFSQIGFWGRDTGAAAVLLHAARDTSVVGIVADSPFADLWEFAREHCGATAAGVVPWASALATPLPHVARLVVQQKAGFDICDVAPRNAASRCRVPALLARGTEDTVVAKWHLKAIRSAYRGKIEVAELKGLCHDAPRPLPFIARAAAFLAATLGRDPEASSGERGTAALILENLQKHYEGGGVQTIRPPPSASQSVCLGLVMEACARCLAFRGATFLPCGMLGIRGQGCAHRMAECPVEFAGHLTFRAEAKVVLCWVLEDAVSAQGCCVDFAVISPMATGLTVVRVNGDARGGVGSGEVRVEALDPVSHVMELGQEYSLSLSLSGGGMTLTVAGVASAKRSAPCCGVVHLWCMHWERKDGGQDVRLDLAGSAELASESSLSFRLAEAPVPPPLSPPPQPLTWKHDVQLTESRTKKRKPQMCEMGTQMTLPLDTLAGDPAVASKGEVVDACAGSPTPRSLPMPKVSGQNARSDRNETSEDQSSFGVTIMIDQPKQKLAGMEGKGVPTENHIVAGAQAVGDQPQTFPPRKGAFPPKGKGKGPPAPQKGVSPSGKGPGKGKSVEPRKPDVKPRVPMKKLFWTPIQVANPDEPTVWDKIHQQGIDFDKDQLEELFANAPRKTNASAETNAKGAPRGYSPSPDGRQKAVRRQFLDEQRRRQLWCMLALMPEPRLLLEAIRILNDKVLGPENVDLLVANLPGQAEEEIARAAIRDIQLGENEVWDTPEDYTNKLLAVPNYAVRIKLWGFLNSFESTFSRLAIAESDSRAAGDLLQSSSRVEKLLGVTLYVGNYLNGGTVRGRADGFDIDTLAKLQELKATRQGTLLDFIVGHVERDCPGMLRELFASGAESCSVHRARRHKMSDASDELASLIAQAESYQKVLDSQAFEELADRTRKLSMRLQQLYELRETFNSWGPRYSALCSWFRMDPNKPRSTDEFFGLWASFFDGVKRALEALEQRRQPRAALRRVFSAQPSGQRPAVGEFSAAALAASSPARPQRRSSVGPRPDDARAAARGAPPRPPAVPALAGLSALMAVTTGPRAMSVVATATEAAAGAADGSAPRSSPRQSPRRPARSRPPRSTQQVTEFHQQGLVANHRSSSI